MPFELYAPGDEGVWLRSCVWFKAFRPRFCETDALGHVSNVSYISYIEFARLDFFNSLDDPQRAPMSFGFLHNAAEITIRFLRPCFYDEALAVHTRIGALGRSSLLLEHAITSEGGDDVRTVARITVVCMSDGQSAPWTEAQRLILAGLMHVVKA